MRHKSRLIHIKSKLLEKINDQIDKDHRNGLPGTPIYYDHYTLIKICDISD